MVSSLGQIPLANPLQNSVLSGVQNYFQTLYSPMAQMAAPLGSLVTAEILDPARAMYYAGRGNQAQTTADLSQQGLTGTMGGAINAMQNAGATPQQIQQYVASMSQRPTAENTQDISRSQLYQQRIPLAQAQTAETAQRGINMGAPITMQPMNINGQPQLSYPMSSQQMPAGSPTNSPQGIPLQNALNTLSQTTSSLPKSSAQNAAFDFSQSASPQYLDTYFSGKNNPSVPQFPTVGPVSEPPTYIATKINSLPSFVNAADSITQLMQQPGVANYMGSTGAAHANRLLAEAKTLAGNAPQGWNDYKALQNQVQNMAESSSKVFTGSAGVKPMQMYMSQFDPTSFSTPAAYQANMMQYINKAKQDTMDTLNQNYPPALRAQAFKSMGSIINSQTYQNYLKSQQPPGAQPSSGAPTAYGSPSPADLNSMSDADVMARYNAAKQQGLLK